MPIGALTVPTSAPVDTTLAYAMTQVQAALDTVAAFVNALETTDGQRVATNAASAIAAATANALVSITQSGAGNAVENYNATAVLTAALTKAGVLTLGDNPVSGYFEGSTQLRVVGGINGLVASLLAALGANANGHDLRFFKSRTTSLTARDNVLSGDELGRVVFEGDTGASDEEAAAIVAEVDGTIYTEVAITTIVRATNVVTITTAAAHNWAPGDVIIVVDVSHTAFNGTFTLSTTPTATTATYAQTASDDSDNTGTAAKRNMPGRLVFKARGDNVTTLAERFRVSATGSDVTQGDDVTAVADNQVIGVFRLSARPAAGALSEYAGLQASAETSYGASGVNGRLEFFTSYNGSRLRRAYFDRFGSLILDPTYSLGIKFPGTQISSGNANTLDDYEEGTFTPTIDGTTAAGAGTYTTQVGTYTKVGRVVHAMIALVWTAHTGTGNMIIKGLPFAADNITGGAGVASFDYANLTYPSPITGYVAATGASIILQSSTTGAGATPLAIDTAATLRCFITYFAAT